MKSSINTYNINVNKESKPTKDYSLIVDKVIETAALEVNFCEVFVIDVSFCNNEYMKKINNDFRNIDKATDVLSFPIVDMINGEIQDIEGDLDLEAGRLLLGDIIISLDMAKCQADEYGHSLDREIAFLTAHGFLHLLGFNHEKQEDEINMFEKQDKILHECGYHRGEKNEF